MNLEQSQLFANRYRLIKEQGRGSFGEVWLAQDEQLDNMQVAVKVYIALDDRGIEEFKKEYKTAYKLNHPNLLHAYHFDISEKRPFLVMPYCPDSALSLIGNCDAETLRRFIKDVSSGLAYLHSLDIVHHDIMPDNILRTEDGTFVITDFGISTKMRSTLRRNSTRAMNHNPTGGSLPYMGPEMFSAKPESVKATDIWAFGVTLYEIITGDLPFFGQGGVMQLNGAEVPELEYKDQEIVKLVKACMAKNPWDRPKAEDLALATSKSNYGFQEQKTEERNMHSLIDAGTEEPEQPVQLISLPSLAKGVIILCILFSSMVAFVVSLDVAPMAGIGGGALSISGCFAMLNKNKWGYYLCLIGGVWILFSFLSEVSSDQFRMLFLGFVIIAATGFGILKIKSRDTGFSSWDIMSYEEFYQPTYGFSLVKKDGKYGMIDSHKAIVIPIENDSLSPVMYCYSGPKGIPGPGLKNRQAFSFTRILGCIYEKGEEKGVYQCKILTGSSSLELVTKMSKSAWWAQEHLT